MIDLSCLSPQEVNRAKHIMLELRRRESGNTLKSFLQAAWRLIEPRRPYVEGWHIDAICEHLEAVSRGEIRNLLINIPPRHAKSTIVSVGFPAWVWSESPEHRFIYASHSFTLSKRDSVKCRQVVQSDWYKDTFKTGWDLKIDQNEKVNYENTAGGGRIATSVEASIIGQGGDTLVLDDPHSPRSVKSDVQRKAELDWIDEEFFTRVNDPKTVTKIIIMQRLDERDCSAHVLATKDWEHLMLPAEFEPERKCVTSIPWEDPRTERGEPLWPQRFGTPELEALKKGMGGERVWAGQGQQRPAPADGSIFKRQYLGKFWTVLPEMEFVALSIDLPFDEGGSFAVFQIWGRRGSDRFLIDQSRAQVGFNEQITMFKTIMAARPHIHAKWIEKKANGAAMISTLQAQFTGLIPITPLGSKEVRAEAVAPQFVAGNVWLPDPSIAPWIHEYIEELVVFNNGKFNDQVDATSQALLMLSQGVVGEWMPVSVTGSSKWLGT